MGLAISVGLLAELKRLDSSGADPLRRSFAYTNRLLARRGLPTWEEPEDLDVTPRTCVASFPYSFLHHLRRAYALLDDASDQRIPPVGPEGLDATWGRVEEVGERRASHLICHSDCDGLYVPVPFDAPIVTDPVTDPGDPDDDEDEPAEITELIGSSYALLRELRELAPGLGIPLDANGDLSDADALRVHQASYGEEHLLWREHIAWLCLFECARLSVEHHTAIHFG